MGPARGAVNLIARMSGNIGRYSCLRNHIERSEEGVCRRTNKRIFVLILTTPGLQWSREVIGPVQTHRGGPALRHNPADWAGRRRKPG